MEEKIIKIADTTANPSPLGLAGFGMTTILLNLHNAGFFPMDTVILAMGMFYGGLAQVIAGVMEFKKNNTFGALAFTSYGFFWIALVGIIVMPSMGLGNAPTKESMACFLGIWGLFSALMFFGTLRINRALQFVFFSLVVLFALLAIATATGNETIHKIAGYEGIICGLSALYTSIAQVLNELYGRIILPVCPVRQKV